MSDEPRDCEHILAHSAHTVRPLIRTQVNRLPQHVRHLAGLHFGWWTDDRTHLDSPADGKALRPALTLLACRAVGADPEAARPAAVAVELIHNASLLHDDIIDGDRTRRHRPALWAAKGIPAAILAGDALFFAAVQTLAQAPRAEQTIPVLLESVQLLIEGEYLDILLETGTDAGEARALAVAVGKTGELLAAACALGAIAGGADPQRAEHLRAFGRHLGIAFQCADDLLGIWGDEQVTGKPALSDLRRRKVSRRWPPPWPETLPRPKPCAPSIAATTPLTRSSAATRPN
ncbi:polyprenyl synthetase family protein [Streptomyces sp. BE20]|uniref:polyprenyl synthetase family protein n=1 Tax=Streptomyces sp. BE20 TaxID=3002525 RepID=UPI002E7772DB|nr:polyprenyl synthetase family protein [Streptomyces sp. BE20]MEE1821069.1 polyprenyl synthetase family protein [Streptomyces sp. BE20]